MSIEKLLGDLVDAVNGLTAAIAASGGAMATPAAGEAAQTDPPKGRGRPKKADTQTADAGGQQAELSPATTSTPAAASDAPAPAVIDAGTGKPVTAPAEVTRESTKARGIELIQKLGEQDTMTNLLRKHAGVADGQPVTFGAVPDAAIPALAADIEAAFPAKSVMD